LKIRTALAVLALGSSAWAQAAAPTPPDAPGAPTPPDAPVEPAPAEPRPEAPPAPSTPAPSPAPAAEAASEPQSETESVFSDLEAELSGKEQAEPRAGGTDTQSAAPSAPSASGNSGALMNPDISLVGDFAAAAFSDSRHLQSGGHDPAENGFNLQALELNARSYVDPYLRFDATLAFSLDGVELEEAYATTLDMPAHLQFRFGQFLSRFGRINSTHPHTWDFVDQPFAIGRMLGGDNNRGVGVEASVLVPLPWFAELSVSSAQATGAETARSFYGNQNPGVDSPADLLYVTALKQFFDLSDDWSLLWGLSGAFGPNANGPDHRTAIYGTDLYVKYRPITRASYFQLTWQSEALHRRRQVADTVLWDFGGYSQIAMRFARRWSTAVRYDYGSRTYDLDSRPTVDPLDPDWAGNRHRVTASLTHSPSEFSRFRLQASRDMPQWRSPIWAVFLAAEAAIGAHGAHPF